MNFDYLENTKILINGKEHLIRFENGMTGIGSRGCWIDDKKLPYNVLRQSEDIEDGNHYIYIILWRKNPWDKALILISEKELPILFEDINKWRNPIKYII